MAGGSDQGALFEVAGAGVTASGKAARARKLRAAPEVIQWPGGIRPWNPIDKADEELGWQHPFVTPRRAYEIRREVERGYR